ncbi:porin [Paraburkholderia tagetis]|uniref:Porin n=1 Tax=Paraburkholderia tagetis TaxID=2913261 RepID=A0A9X1RH04_9BURK|nr:porin [Paraburkholderia tagetis]MCG5072646.1 porin [Paraburkholderia tagetis]
MRKTKKTIVAAALTGVFATAAHAQSSVALYGLIDAGVTYANNQAGHSSWQQTSGTVNGSRWGLRGAEDLGGGLKAVFTLENGFSISNGSALQNNRLFGRQAFVGLASDAFGSVTLGRQYDSVIDFVAPISLTASPYGGTIAAHPFDNDNLNSTIRINNSVKFTSANYGGFKFGALYGFSNTAGEFANNRAYSAGASYRYGGLNVGVGYLQLNNDINHLATSTSSPGAVTGSAPFAAGTQRTAGAGVGYTVGPVTAGVVYTQTNLSNALGGSISAAQAGTALPIRLQANSARLQNIEGNVRYALTPMLTLAGSYTYTRTNFGAGENPNFNQVNLQAQYAMSKRTSVYLQGDWQHVSANPYGVGAHLNGLNSASATQDQVAVSTGLRHTF